VSIKCRCAVSSDPQSKVLRSQQNEEIMQMRSPTLRSRSPWHSFSYDERLPTAHSTRCWNSCNNRLLSPSYALLCKHKEALKPSLYVDNQAAIAMVNERKPTPHSRHIHIQHFAIQEWRAAGDIELHHIPDTINASDQATKALGWTLHSRHVRQSMGHHRPH
jgi:hypothetical protein